MKELDRYVPLCAILRYPFSTPAPLITPPLLDIAETEMLVHAQLTLHEHLRSIHKANRGPSKICRRRFMKKHEITPEEFRTEHYQTLFRIEYPEVGE